MKNEHIDVPFRVATEGELSAEERQLVQEAREATHTSFSPYSHFSVGACLLLENGERIHGSNQENAAFTTGLCAERTAIFYANANYPEVPVKTLAIAARGVDGNFTDEPISPCGACRQVLAEAEHRFSKPFRLLLCGKEKIYVVESATTLLPFSFTADAL